MYKKILLPTDGSDLSAQASAAAIAFARACGSEIVALSVAQPHPYMPADNGLMIDPAIESRVLLEFAQQNVDQVAQAAQAAGVDCKTSVVLSLFPPDEIIKAATDEHCDLIFMASHGRHGLSRLLAGSVTQHVLVNSAIPVLVLRPKAHQGSAAASGGTARPAP